MRARCAPYRDHGGNAEDHRPDQKPPCPAPAPTPSSLLNKRLNLGTHRIRRGVPRGLNQHHDTTVAITKLVVKALPRRATSSRASGGAVAMPAVCWSSVGGLLRRRCRGAIRLVPTSIRVCARCRPRL